MSKAAGRAGRLAEAMTLVRRVLAETRQAGVAADGVRASTVASDSGNVQSLGHGSAFTTSLLGPRWLKDGFKSGVWVLSPRSCGFLGGTDGIRATSLKLAIQNRNADGGFSLLTCKGPCPKLRANNPFVLTDRGFHERAAAAVSQILHAGEAAWKDERDLRREGIELLGWAQFAPRAHLPFADHVHDFDSG
jgi:hypothetical protein